MLEFSLGLLEFSRSRGLLDIVFLDVLEVAVGSHFQLVCSHFIADDDAMLVELECADGPSLCNRTFDGSVESLCLVVAIAENHHLSCVHHGAYTYGKSQSRNSLRIVAEEA